MKKTTKQPQVIIQNCNFDIKPPEPDAQFLNAIISLAKAAEANAKAIESTTRMLTGNTTAIRIDQAGVTTD